MKRIINGKRYDTETATEVATWSNGYSETDFHCCEETLYRTAKGAWFVVGEGGPLSSYSVQYGSETSGSTELRPLTTQEAFAWLEKREKPIAIETYFADKITDA